MLPAIRDNRVLEEAARLAADGELGNSDAIALIQMPHRPQDIAQVLVRFDQQLTREARSKLTLAAYVPLPARVPNQRYEPIFEKYPITGKTYTTASGSVTLNEIQYYNGQMVQVYGECGNLARVSDALAGSGYKPLTIKRANGRERALGQFWAHTLTDTSLRPYNASFLVVVAVPDDTPDEAACLRADGHPAASLLPMLDGCFDPATAVYQNRARLFFVRLLDSTQVAIEVGRERMGTDKRPGFIELTQYGKQLTFSVQDGQQRSVGRVNFMPPNDPAAFGAEIARAAAGAGIALPSMPRGSEHVYPCVARIGTAPAVQWQWRTDIVPQLQYAAPNSVRFDARSEEGAMLIDWGFEPKLLGYLPNVRGAITGVPEGSAARRLRVRILP